MGAWLATVINNHRTFQISPEMTPLDAEAIEYEAVARVHLSRYGLFECRHTVIVPFVTARNDVRSSHCLGVLVQGVENLNLAIRTRMTAMVSDIVSMKRLEAFA
jgi:hypothetical protein